MTFARSSLQSAAFLCVFICASHVFAQAVSVPNADLDNRILTAFSQTYRSGVGIDEKRFGASSYGNCVAIAHIKTLMTTFGPDAVLKTSIPAFNSASQYDVTLRDGSHVTLLQSEWDMEQNNLQYDSGFQLPKSGGDADILSRANFLFAVMAKRVTDPAFLPLFEGIRAQKGFKLSSGHATLQSYADALDLLNIGINVEGPPELNFPEAKLLGVTLQRINAPPANAAAPYLYALARHVVLAYGATSDMDATPADFKKLLSQHCKFVTCWGWFGHEENTNPLKYQMMDAAPSR